jgi:hypothetical protein
MIVGEYTCTVTKFIVSEKKPRGRIEVAGIVANPPSAPIPPGNIFKLDEDSDQTFEGMASICSLAVLVGSTIKIRVLTGANDEIDELEF